MARRKADFDNIAAFSKSQAKAAGFSTRKNAYKTDPANFGPDGRPLKPGKVIVGDADFEAKHPRHPAGTSAGGEFRDKGTGSAERQAQLVRNAQRALQPLMDVMLGKRKK